MLSKLPEGNDGIAARYEGDAGIAQDSAVVFYDGFENGLGKWDHTWGEKTCGVCQTTQQSEHTFSGKSALELTMIRPASEYRSNAGVHKYFKEGYETLFLRYYLKYAADTDIYHGGAHNGGDISGRAPGVPQAEPGVAANGKNKFDVLLDFWRPVKQVASPGDVVIYCYHADQKYGFGEQFFPSGKILFPVGPGQEAKPSENLFGDQFVPRPNFIPALDRWYCYELMVKLNTVGQRDGRIAVWIDGKVRADFPNLRFRDVDILKANRIGLCNYTMNKNVQRSCTMWFDDLVAARSYIGPMLTKKENAERTAGALTAGVSK